MRCSHTGRVEVPAYVMLHQIFSSLKRVRLTWLLVLLIGSTAMMKQWSIQNNPINLKVTPWGIQRSYLPHNRFSVQIEKDQLPFSLNLSQDRTGLIGHCTLFPVQKDTWNHECLTFYIYIYTHTTLILL